MEECRICSERRLFQHDVRSACEIRNQIYWVGMTDREEGRKEWESMERKVIKSIHQFLF